MSSESVDKSRRRMLIGATAGVAAVGGIYASVPFIKYWTPSAKAISAGAPVSIDVSKLEEGQLVTVAYRRRPMLVVKRSADAIKRLAKVEQLGDPNSDVSLQPDYTKNEVRAIRADVAVLDAGCTHLGCIPTYKPKVEGDWNGGFVCPCHGSRFDLAGRVHKSQPAPTNLSIPKHKYIDENTLVIGIDEEEEGAA